MNSGWKSTSESSSSASLKWSGNDAADVLHSFTAQETKFAVMTFMIDEFVRFYWGFFGREKKS